MQFILDPRAFDLAKKGKRRASTNSTQAIVTRSSIRVKALIDLVRSDCLWSSYDMWRRLLTKKVPLDWLGLGMVAQPVGQVIGGL